MQGFKFSCPVQVRWRDLDAFAHVNNAAIVSYLEIARAELWKKQMGGAAANDIPFVIARLEVDYRRPISLYDEVRVGLRAAEIRATSFVFYYQIEAAHEVAVEARTVQVCVRPETGRPVRVPAPLITGLETLVVD